MNRYGNSIVGTRAFGGVVTACGEKMSSSRRPTEVQAREITYLKEAGEYGLILVEFDNPEIQIMPRFGELVIRVSPRTEVFDEREPVKEEDGGG